MWNNGFRCGTENPRGSSSIHNVVDILVKMKTKKNMIIVLLIISTLTAGLIPVYAAPNQLTVIQSEEARSITKVKPAPLNTLTARRQLEVVDLSNLDESKIDERISEAQNAEPIKEDVGSPLWYLHAYGYTINSEPVTDAAQTRFRVKLQMIAEKVKATPFGVLYKIHWGRVTHNGEQYTVTGYALLDSNGIFYMSLEGETTFKAIGQIHGAWFGVRVSMKGCIVEDGITYSHQMRGWAIPLTQRLIARLRNHIQ
jgi:hypothetical protein